MARTALCVEGAVLLGCLGCENLTSSALGLNGPKHLLGLLLDSQLTTVEAALGAYTVVEYCAAAVRAGYNRRNNGLVVSSSLISTSRRDFVFRMCHFAFVFISLTYLLLFYSSVIFALRASSWAFQLPLSSSVADSSRAASSRSVIVRKRSIISGSHSPSGCTRW